MQTWWCRRSYACGPYGGWWLGGQLAGGASIAALRAHAHSHALNTQYHTPPARSDFFLRPENYASCQSLLVQRFGELVRKVWNPRAFKGQVSPHEFMQARGSWLLARSSWHAAAGSCRVLHGMRQVFVLLGWQSSIGPHLGSSGASQFGFGFGWATARQLHIPPPLLLAAVPAPPPAYTGAGPPASPQAVMSASSKRFIIDRQSDPLEFLSWLVNSLHLDLTGGKRKKRSGEGCGACWEPVGHACSTLSLSLLPPLLPLLPSLWPAVITDCLQGELEVVTEAGTGKAKEAIKDVIDHVPFLMLGALWSPAGLGAPRACLPLAFLRWDAFLTTDRPCALAAPPCPSCRPGPACRAPVQGCTGEGDHPSGPHLRHPAQV